MSVENANQWTIPLRMFAADKDALAYFETGVLDTTVPSIAIVNRSKIFVDDPEYTPASYRKAATGSGYF